MKADNQNNISPNKSNTEQMAIKTTLKISQIKNNPNNPRLIKDDKFKKLVKSLKDFPIMAKKLRKVVVDENNVILGGNMRFKAMKEAGLKEVYVEYFTREDAEENNKLAKQLDPDFKDKTYEDQCNEFIIKDNVSGGEWDMDMLANEWDANELDEWGLDTPDNWGEDKEVEEDEAPEVSDEPPKSKLGEIYQLGRHRVMCGDSTSLTDAELLMNGKNASIAFTSPPYNAGTTPTEVKMGKKSKYANDSDNKSQDDYLEFMQLWTNIANEYSEYNFVNVQMLSGNKLALLDYLSLYRNNLADIIIWNKLTAQPAMADNVLNSQFEFILVFSDKSNRAIGTKHFRGTASNVLDISKQTNNEVKDHNATFPVELPHNIVTTFSNKDEIILDLFLGSGSTLIACEQTDRTCYGMELDPKYVDVIRKRYHKFVTGSEEGWEDGTPTTD